MGVPCHVSIQGLVGWFQYCDLDGIIFGICVADLVRFETLKLSVLCDSQLPRRATSDANSQLSRANARDHSMPSAWNAWRHEISYPCPRAECIHTYIHVSMNSKLVMIPHLFYFQRSLAVTFRHPIQPISKSSSKCPSTRWFSSSSHDQSAIMKRKAQSAEPIARKAAKVDDYCNAEMRRDTEGNSIWPAPDEQMIAARAFLQEWYVDWPSRQCHLTQHSAAAQKPTLIVPDKDADGLSAGVIIHRTLVKLGLDERHLDVYLVQKGSNIHQEHERKSMLEKRPKYVIVLDQGSRGGPPVIDDPEAKSLLIDHHLSDDFPMDAQV